MKTKQTLTVMLILSLLLGSVPAVPALSANTLVGVAPPPPAMPVSGTGVGDKEGGETPLPEGVSTDWWAHVQEGIRLSEYEITWQDQTYLPGLPGAYQAPNRANNLRTYFTPQGIRVIPRDTQAPYWQLGLTLVGFGTAGESLPVGQAALQVEANRVDYLREALSEWYLNDEAGLEHGLVLDSPSSIPGGAQTPVIIDLAISGDLIPALTLDGAGVEFATPDGQVVLRYANLLASDADGRIFPVEMALFPGSSGLDTAGTVLRLSLPPVSYPLTLKAWLTSPSSLQAVFGSLSPTASWSGEGDQSYAFFGFAVGTAGDVNGDGYSDVIVGAYGYDEPEWDRGKVFVYHGSPRGLSKTADWWAVGGVGDARLGWSVGTAGDVNGDGYADIIVGAPVYDRGHTNEGMAYVWYGSEDGLGIDNRQADWAVQSNQDHAWLGYSVGTAGDVDGNGYDDVIVGAPYYENPADNQGDEGGAFVWYGLDDGDGLCEGVTPCLVDLSSADFAAEGDQGSAWFGLSVGTAGDVDGDGDDEIIVGAPQYENPLDSQTNEGMAFVWYGGDGGLGSTGDPGNADWKAEGNQVDGWFGRSLGTAGDVNGDGYGDIIIGAPRYDNGQVDEGVIFVWYGSDGGLGEDGNPGNASWTGESDQDFASYHANGDRTSKVGTAGDVNGDGYSDIIFGVSVYDSGQGNEGIILVWLGSASGLVGPSGSPGNADWMVESNQANACFGEAVGAAGDVNGDGFSDIIVGASVYDNPEVEEGGAFVYHGSSQRLGGTASWSGEGDQSYAFFGFAVGTAGDVNGDGYSDVIVGAYGYDEPEWDRGKVFVYHGSPRGLSKTADWWAVGGVGDAWFGWSVSTAGDVNGDGYADIIVGAPAYDQGHTNEGMAYVWYGSEDGLGIDNRQADWAVESNQDHAWLGYSVGTAGDVDGNGYDDVIVGAPYYENPADNQGDEGGAFVWYGSADGLCEGITPCLVDLSSADFAAEGDQGSAWFGLSVGTAGDVDGDGDDEIIVGAPQYENPLDSQTNEGMAFVWYGGDGGLGSTGDPGNADWKAEGNQPDGIVGRSVGTAGDVNGDGYGDIIVSAPLYNNPEVDEGVIFVWYGSGGGLGEDGHPGNASWTGESDQAYASQYWDGYRLWTSTVGAAGDVNGDGYSDIIFGTPFYDNGHGNEGAIFVWVGSVNGLVGSQGNPGNADWMVESNQDHAWFGISVGTAGDVNGDGYSDLIVGARLYDNGQGDEGGAFVYHGSRQRLGGTASWSGEGDQAGAQFGYAVGTAGDVDGDGYSDVIVGAPYYDQGQPGEGLVYIYYGSASGLITETVWTAEYDQANALFGSAVGTAGDVNGDGYSDIIVGAYGFTNGQVEEGAAFVWHGSEYRMGPSGDPDNAAWVAEGNQSQAYFGRAVSTAGDVNGDGYSDVVVGADGYSHGQDNEGRAYVYLGSASGLSPGPAWTDESDQAGAAFGYAVGTARDIDGDSYSDVIVGAYKFDHGETDEGRVYVYRGSKTGLPSDPDWTAEGDQVGARLGFSVGTAGDVNGDGYSEVIVGAPRYDHGQSIKDGDEGSVFAWYGSAGGLGSTGNPDNVDWHVEGNRDNAQFGFSVGVAGDVNGDGYADVIIGAPYYNNGPDEEGRAFVYVGSPMGLSITPRWTAEGDQGSAQFGLSVGTAGDVNGDGYADVIVGAPLYNHENLAQTVTDVGLAGLYLGNGGDNLSTLPRQLRADGTPIPLLGLSDSSTAVWLSLIGRIPLGRADVKLYWQIAPLGTPFTSTTVIGGTSAGWSDTGTSGLVIVEEVTGLTPGTAYHWRVRLLYRPGNQLGLPAGRWIHIPWDSWSEQDFRTAPGSKEVFLPVVTR